jgi:hypothetical protein
MPRYISHKRVWALEIDTVAPHVSGPGGDFPAMLTFRDNGFAAISVPDEMFSRYKPVPGDFYVVYADGYKSFSPRKAFLEGYRREEGAPPLASPDDFTAKLELQQMREKLVARPTVISPGLDAAIDHELKYPPGSIVGGYGETAAAAKTCAFENCEAPATELACGRKGFFDRGDSHPVPAHYCATHAKVVVGEQSPEYDAECPNCGCTFGVN